MTKEKDIKTVVPALRFPEFRDSEGWKVKPLKDVAKFYKGKGLSKNEMSDSGLNCCVHYGELFTKYPEVINEVYSKTNVGNCFLSQANDVLMPTSDVTPSGLAKACCINLDNIQLGGDIIVIRTRKKDIAGEFLSRYIRYKERDVLKLVSGTTVYHLYSSSLENLQLSFPYKIEQKKIADCFSSLDDLISAVADKIEVLKEHKKGLMQQIFPADGSNVPTRRFPEFKSSNKWYEKRIIDLKLEIITGFAFKGNDISELKDGIRLMRGVNITEGYVRHTNVIDRYYLGDTERLSKYFLKVNDLVIGMDGSKVGKNMALITDVDSKSLLVQRVARLRSQNVSLIKYLFQQINSSRFFSYVDRINTSSGIPHISQKQIEEFLVWIPDDELEIKKIGDILISIDDQIFAETQKLEQLKAHKKGLTQRLFPKI